MKVQYYITKSGKTPVIEWLDDLRDKKAKAAIFSRIDRLELNLVGDYKPLRDGICELRIKGYRIYFAQTGKNVVMLWEER